MMATEDSIMEVMSPSDQSACGHSSPLNSTDPESPLSPPSELSEHVSALSAEYTAEDKVYSSNHPDSSIAAVLNAQSKHLWKQFDALDTEMIVTRRGRLVHRFIACVPSLIGQCSACH